jgi:hypothetical protein
MTTGYKQITPPPGANIPARNSRISQQNQSAEKIGLFRCGNPLHNRA